MATETTWEEDENKGEWQFVGKKWVKKPAKQHKKWTWGEKSHSKSLQECWELHYPMAVGCGANGLRPGWQPPVVLVGYKCPPHHSVPALGQLCQAGLRRRCAGVANHFAASHAMTSAAAAATWANLCLADWQSPLCVQGFFSLWL